MMTIDQAISDSIREDRIVTLKYRRDSPEWAEAARELAALCDDYAEHMELARLGDDFDGDVLVREYWGTDWRVHLHGEPSITNP